MLKSFITRKAPMIALGLASVGLLSAAAVTSDTTFTGSITLSSDQFDNYFVYNANGGAIEGIKGVGITNPFSGQTQFVPAGTFPVSESIPEYITSGVATALGMYSDTGVSVAVNQSVYNSAVGTKTWDEVFTGTPEDSIASALASGDQTTLLAFLNQYSSDFISFDSNTSTPTAGGILHFSTAAPGGSLTFASITAVGTPPVPVPSSATPEPSTQLLLAVGFGVAALAGRKLRKV